MIYKATLTEFRSRYGTNDHRRKLLADLDSFLVELAGNFNTFRVLVYGSFTSAKEFPGDIDVMACVCSTPADLGFAR